ncbi:MAG: Triosephosphate isomerase [Alphaproteobacteria bacterium MarineAlpha5_Bin9]|nr:MAG: Triosephosphate isomerase [Alphaproteobacteria bacterium MarineAlpha5_Bin9]|tara:strand:- start:1097 stop:1816 length:720 start_codon:yes stop_codon:yes gene_type:complete
MIKLPKNKKIIISNWKSNGSLRFLKKYLQKIKINKRNSLIILCPPSPFINSINTKKLFKGSQDCSIYPKGAYTGENNIDILKDIGCDFCIVGHSERRKYFREDSKIIFHKVNICIKSEITPILCIGETLKQKKLKQTKLVIRKQIINSIPKNIKTNNIIIAYEPRWAIGTGLVPKLKEISDIHLFIKKNVLKNMNFKVLYGGSVNSSNSSDILNLRGVDGLLVGGASKDISEFNKILKF